MKSKLQQRREMFNLSVSDVAVLSDISISCIRRIEASDGDRNTHIGVAMALADALDCEVTDLFDRRQLTTVGRPPHTGRPITKRNEELLNRVEQLGNAATYYASPRSDGELCASCQVFRPKAVGCEECAERELQAAAREREVQQLESWLQLS